MFDGTIEGQIKMALSLALGHKRPTTSAATYGPGKTATLRQ